MYQLRPPAPALAPYIEHYWFVTPGAPAGAGSGPAAPEGAPAPPGWPAPGPVQLRVEVFVDARADLIFNFGAPYRRQVIGGEATEHATSNLDAQRLVPIRIEQEGDVHVVGVRFRLGGLGPFTRGDLRRWTGATPPPAEVLGEGALALEAALVQLDPDAAAPVLDRFFAARLQRDAGRLGFERALDALEERGGGLDVGTLAARLGTTPRQVDRWFARQLGLPPKTVGRVIRFQGALRALMRDPGVPLAEVAAAAGYYDQAHFVREFRRMTGGVPRGYRGYYPPEGPVDFAPNVVVFVQDERRRPARG